MTAADLETIGAWLARRDVPDLAAVEVDVVVLCGSAVLAGVELAAHAVHEGAAGSVLVTGGIGHSTRLLEAALAAHPAYADVVTGGRAEAALLAEVLVRHLDVPADLVETEEESTNCGENAAFSLAALRRRGRPRVLLVQDPTMQRRTHAGFDHGQRDLDDPVDRIEVVSLAPFAPVVGPDGVGPADGGPAWSLDRFTSLALGEVRRLRDDERGYGPRGAGFIGHVDVPAQVLAAERRLLRTAPASLTSR